MDMERSEGRKDTVGANTRRCAQDMGDLRNKVQRKKRERKRGR